MDFLESDFEDFSSFSTSNPSQVDLSLSQDVAFERDVDDLFQLIYPETSHQSIQTTTTTSSASEEPHFHSQPQFDYCPPPQIKSECSDETPPLYSVLSTPDESMPQQNFPEEEHSISQPFNRKRKIEIDEFDPNPVQREKVIKRRERNRESAAASRQRKKDHITILENQVKELKEERVNLGRQMSFIEGENRAMKDEINNISNLITTSPLLSGMWNRYNTPSTVPQTVPKDIRHSPAVKAAFFLFLVLFCAFNSSSPIEAQSKMAQPLLTTYFNFLATDGNHLAQDQLQGLMDIWLSDPFGLQSHSGNSDNFLLGLSDGLNSEFIGDIPDLSDFLTETQSLLLSGGAGADLDTISTLNPSLYEAVFQVVNSAGSVNMV